MRTMANPSEMPASNEVLGKDNNELSYMGLFGIFFKIGCLSFGGFMALISVIENIIVNQRKLMQHKEMLDGISLANLLPGPMAVNLVTYTGYRLHGAIGALLAATAVILPSFFLILGLSIIYFKYGNITGVQNAFQGFLPAIAAVVLSVVWRMGKKTITNNIAVLIASTAAVTLYALPKELLIYAPLIIFPVAAFFGAKFLKINTVQIYLNTNERSNKISYIPVLFLISLVSVFFVYTPSSDNTYLMLLLTFSSMSLILFGGGYVFIPIIGSIVVAEYGWLTHQEFTDGIALGQITPGPILISATFIGYKVAGITGALISTVAIFAPPAILMVSMSKLLDKLNNSIKSQAAIRGIHCAVIGMIYSAAIVLLQSAFNPSEFSATWITTSVIFILSIVALLKFKLDIIWVIPTAGLLGFILY